MDTGKRNLSRLSSVGDLPNFEVWLATIFKKGMRCKCYKVEVNQIEYQYGMLIML